MAAALGSQEQEALRLGFGEGKLTPPGRQMLQAHVLQQEMRSAKVSCIHSFIFPAILQGQGWQINKPA